MQLIYFSVPDKSLLPKDSKIGHLPQFVLYLLLFAYSFIFSFKLTQLHTDCRSSFLRFIPLLILIKMPFNATFQMPSEELYEFV